MTSHRWHVRVAPILAAAVLITLLFPASMAAHAALDAPTPADGTTVQGTPTEVAGTFTQDLETDGSSLQLRNAAGEVVATGAVDPADDRRMVITELPELEAGDYEVRWTTLSAEDGELDRDTWTFTVAAAATPTVAPTPSAQPSSSLPVEATPGGLPSPSPGPIATEGQNPDPDPAVAATDVILPIVAGLAIVLVAAGALLRRRGRTGPSGRSGPSA